MVSNSASRLSVSLTALVASFITSLPSFIVALVIMLLALFYFSKDYDKIAQGIEKALPKRVSAFLPRIKRDVIGIMLKYLKSYSLLLLLTLVELFTGFLIIRIDHPLTLALLISIVDLLPVLGVGTVLVPWSIILLATGKTLTGIGILILFAVCYIVRQLAEPKILSKQMNVHPLITIFAMYAGFKITGIAGLILAPFLTFVIKTICVSIKKEKTVENQVKL
jgi:sporulation integral membrane protein YtvI